MLKPEIKNTLLQRASELISSSEFIKEVEEDRKVLKEFVERYPFRDHPTLIDQLTPHSLYNPKHESFFYFFEFGLKHVGAIRLYNNRPWREARDKIDLFKQLLKLVVDDSKSIHEKIDDERWSQLKGWGGDKHIVKKLVFIYYPEEVLPTFKTEMLENHLNRLGLVERAESEAQRTFNSRLTDLTVGKKFQVYNEVLLSSVKEALTSNYKWDTPAIARLLDNFNPPPRPIITSDKKMISPLSKVPLLYEPVNELGVVLLFGMYHMDLGFPYIIKIQQTFPDMIALDDEGNYCRIEFEYRSSTFLEHKHDPNGCDYIVCWIDDLEEQSPIKDKIISLKEEIFEIAETEPEP